MLLVDDEPGVLATTEAILADSCDVTVAASAEEAARYLRGQQFDVVCSDYALGGGMNGLQLLQLVGAHAGRVLITGHNQVDGNVADCYVLFKPCAPQRLLDVIERAGSQALSRRRVGRATAEIKRSVDRIGSAARHTDGASRQTAEYGVVGSPGKRRGE